MKTALIILLGLSLAFGVAAKSSNRGATGGSHAVKGYTKRDGTYVAPSHATNPDVTKSNNWSQKGNSNPYTGKEGTKR